MVNHILNYKNNGPGADIDGRDYSGKTGTTELSKDTIFAGYTPDFVVLGWNGNNDNSSMSSRAFGENVTKPWVVNLSQRIAPFFPEKSPFPRPGGLVSGNSCGSSNSNNDDSDLECAESGGDLLIEGNVPPGYIYSKTFRVCTDQPTKLARDLDENLGFATDKNVKVFKMASPSLQPYLDAAVDNANLIPTEFCDKQRSPNGSNPWGVFSSPSNNQVVSGSINVNIQGYSVEGATTKIEVYIGDPGNGVMVGSENGDSFSGSIDLSAYETARIPIYARVFDNTGKVGDSFVYVNVNASVNSDLVITSPASPVTADSTQSIGYSWAGGYNFTKVLVSISGPGGYASTLEIPIGGSVSWTPPAGDYSLFLRGFVGDGSVVFGPSYSVTAE
jgi:hypothetical protein